MTMVCEPRAAGGLGEVPFGPLGGDPTISSRLIARGPQPDYSAVGTAGEDRPASTRRAPYPQPYPHPWLRFVREQLQAIAALPEGWDSYGAPSPKPHLVWAGRGLIDCLAQAPDLPQPHVNPTRSGGVQFEWEVGERYFELEIVGERAAAYLYCDDAGGVEETGSVFKLESLEPVLDFVRKVGAPK